MNDEQDEKTKEIMDNVMIQICENGQIDRFYLYSIIMEMMEEDGYLMPEDIEFRTVH